MSLKLIKTRTPEYCGSCKIIMGTTWIIEAENDERTSQVCLCDSCAKDLYKQMTIEMYLDRFCKKGTEQEFSMVINDSELSEYINASSIKRVQIPVNIASPLGFIYYEITASIKKILKWGPVPDQQIKESVIKVGSVTGTIRDQTKYEFQFIGIIE